MKTRIEKQLNKLRMTLLLFSIFLLWKPSVLGAYIDSVPFQFKPDLVPTFPIDNSKTEMEFLAYLLVAYSFQTLTPGVYFPEHLHVDVPLRKMDHKNQKKYWRFEFIVGTILLSQAIRDKTIYNTKTYAGIDLAVSIQEEMQEGFYRPVDESFDRNMIYQLTNFEIGLSPRYFQRYHLVGRYPRLTTSFSWYLGPRFFLKKNQELLLDNDRKILNDLSSQNWQGGLGIDVGTRLKLGILYLSFEFSMGGGLESFAFRSSAGISIDSIDRDFFYITPFFRSIILSSVSFWRWFSTKEVDR